MKLTKLMHRLVSLAVIFVASLALCGVTAPKAAFADSSHIHPVCGATHADIGNHTGLCESATWTAWSGKDFNEEVGGIQLASGSYYLADNVAVSQTVIIPEGASVSLCLNGKVLSSKGAVKVIYVLPEATLNICDCNSGSQTHSFNSSSGAWTLELTGDKEIKGGVITGGCAKKDAGAPSGVNGKYFNAGGGICVEKGALNLFGGNIVGNKSLWYQGGGVNVYAGTFTIYGGSIRGNLSSGNAGGVAVANDTESRLIIYAGTISDNTASKRGGGVSVGGGSFVMQGGVISKNHAGTSGGGVYANAPFLMMAGEISENSAASYGGGVAFPPDIKDVFVLSGDISITNNVRINGKSDDTADDICLSKNTTSLKQGLITVAGKLPEDPVTPAVITQMNLGYSSVGYPLVKGITVDASQATPYVVTDQDMAFFDVSQILSIANEDNPNKFEVVHDKKNNQYVVGTDASGMIVDLAQNELVYNGESQKPAVAVSLNGSQLTEETDYVIAWPEDTKNVGSKTVEVYGSCTAPNYNVGQALQAYSIIPKSINPQVTGVNASYVYNGAAIEPEVTVMDGDTVLKEKTGSDENAEGDYTVIYGNNTTVSQGGSVKVVLEGNYEGEADSFFQIAPAEMQYIAPTPKEGLVYCASKMELVNKGSVERGGTMLYSLSKEGPYTEKVPVASDADTYTVWYRIEDPEGNFINVEPTPISVTIDCAHLNIVGAAATGKTYDGSDKVSIDSVFVTGVYEEEDVRVDTSGLQGALSGADAGSYDSVALPELTLEGTNARNYTAGPESSVSLLTPVTINPVDVSEAVNLSILLGSSEEQSVSIVDAVKGLQGYLSTDEEALVYTLDPSYDTNLFENVSVTDGILSFELKQGVSAGTYKDAFVVQVSGMHNYTTASFVVTVEVKPEPSVAGSSDASGTPSTGDSSSILMGALGILLLISGLMAVTSKSRLLYQLRNSFSLE